MYAPASVEFTDIKGMFVELDFKKRFQFIETQNAWALQHGFTHEIFVGPEGDTRRFATIKKTVATVCIDENADGPVTEKWQIRHVWSFPLRNSYQA